MATEQGAYMAFTVELEEWVGERWHHFITRRSHTGFADAAVPLSSVQRRVGVLFRALGGAPGMRIEAASPRQMQLRRSLLQKVAGTCQHLPVAWREENSLRLPEQLDVFAEPALNTELYLWLAMLAAHTPQQLRHWGRDNQQAVADLLLAYPALQRRYAALVKALLPLRPNPEHLPPAEAALERAIVQALITPGSVREFPASNKAPQPVWLWLYPGEALDAPQNLEEPEESEEGGSAPSKKAQISRRRGERVHEPDGKDGLLLFRLESLFSWSEYVKLDRTADDADDVDAARVAEDLDQLSLSRQRTRKTGGLRLDLDLPAPSEDDLPLGPGIHLPEWDFRRSQLLDEHVCLTPMLPRDATPKPLPLRLNRQAKKLRRQFEQLSARRTWLRQQPQGEELDMAAWLDFHVESRHGACVERGLYRQLVRRERDLACLLLADLSMSTEAHLDDERRVIDGIADSLLLLGEALANLGDHFAMYGFSSLRRQHVRFYQLKAFGEHYGDNVRGRIQALKPGYYTRMGAAIRQGTAHLTAQGQSQKLLLLLSDGKPNDLDVYEGRYGIEDTREAVLAARRQGIEPFCITIDREADSYLPYMFGAKGYTLIKDALQLPERLPQLYRQLTER